MKIDALFTERRTKVSDKDYQPLSVTKRGVLPQLEHAAKTNDGDNRKLVKAGDFVINSRSDRKGSCGVSELDGSVSLINIVLTPRRELNRSYVHYLLRSQPFSEEFYRNGRGIVSDLWTTRYSEMRTIQLPVPPRKEQEQIVRFLDWKVSTINRLVRIRRKEIADFKELRSQAINKTITGSANSKSWDTARIGQLAWIRARLGWKGLKATEYTTDGYPFLSAFNIINDQLVWDDVNFISKFRYDESPEIKLAVGDILLVKDGAGIGKCARIDEMPLGEATPNGSLAVITPESSLDYKFLYYFLISNSFKNESNRVITGMGVPHLTQHFLKNVEVPVPPLSEQREIADYLDSVCTKIDHAIELNRKKIAALGELKTTLVSDVVTGKMDVRGVKVPAHERVGDDAGNEPEETYEVSFGEEE
ncbi:MAG: restriction endonuclease subunit S [Olsenella sp.]|jgi:type I restriction enzyme S subunit|nr:restriction endonuclease subunit S [Olsenella sp.]